MKVWKFRLKEAASVYSNVTVAHSIAFVSTDEPKWKDWTFTETASGIDIVPPSGFSVLFVPYENLYFVLRQPEVPAKAAKKA